MNNTSTEGDIKRMGKYLPKTMWEDGGMWENKDVLS